MDDSDRGLFSHHHHSNEYAYQQVYTEPEHQAKLSHELIGGAAAFAAMKAYERKEANEGKPPSHKLGKEILAGLAGFEVDRLAETKGMDAYSKHEAKKHAEEQAMHMYDAQYNRDEYQGGNSVPNYQGYGGPPEGGFRQYDGDRGGYQGNQSGGFDPNFQGGRGGYQEGYGGQDQGYNSQQGGYQQGNY